MSMEASGLILYILKHIGIRITIFALFVIAYGGLAWLCALPSGMI